MIPQVSLFATRFLGIFIEAAPFLLLGSLASGLIEAFVRREDIARVLPGNVVLATLVGGMMGFAFPVCECGVVPVTRRLFNKGMPVSVGIAFLLGAPVMNPVVLASTYAAFGFGPVLILRYVMTLIVAVGVALVFSVKINPLRIMRGHMLFQPVGGGGPLQEESDRAALLPGLKQALVVARGEFFEMGRYLIFGSLLAALMGSYGLDQALEGLANNPVNSVFVMQIVAFVLSICSTVDAFLALAFSGTFTTGSILAFLVFGPMVDIKSSLMFLGVFRRRVVAYLIILPFLLTAFLSIALNYHAGL